VPEIQEDGQVCTTLPLFNCVIPDRLAIFIFKSSFGGIINFVFCLFLQVKVDMGQPILSGPEIPTKIPATQNNAVVKAGLEVDGLTWNVTCVSMGNPHCITFGTTNSQVNLYMFILFLWFHLLSFISDFCCHLPPLPLENYLSHFC
jgi:hypothetical protein